MAVEKICASVSVCCVCVFAKSIDSFMNDGIVVLGWYYLCRSFCIKLFYSISLTCTAEVVVVFFIIFILTTHSPLPRLGFSEAHNYIELSSPSHSLMVELQLQDLVAKVRQVKKGISLTKYLLGAATVLITIAALPFIRLILQADGVWSTGATTIYWLAISRCGFSVALYPWWLATAKSVLYYKRLRYGSNVVIAVTLFLSICRSLLAPVKPNKYEDISATTVQFRLVSSLYWTSVLLGSFIIIPAYIRRARLFQSKSSILYIMAIPFILVMLVSVVIHEWSGNIFLVSYSPFLIMILFGCAIISEKYNENILIFDEAYIIVVGKCYQLS